MMELFKFKTTDLPGLKLVSPFFSEDDRGFFLKSYEQDIFRDNGIDTNGYELFYSKSVKGTVRGLHFQRRNCQDKLVQVLHGTVYDVVVDLRKGSVTCGRWEGFMLTAENRQMLYIPKGFAHGFLALEDDTLFSYLCGDRYDPESDGGIRWNDPELAVNWGVTDPVLSQKDQELPWLRDAETGF